MVASPLSTYLRNVKTPKVDGLPWNSRKKLEAWKEIAKELAAGII